MRIAAAVAVFFFAAGCSGESVSETPEGSPPAATNPAEEGRPAAPEPVPAAGAKDLGPAARAPATTALPRVNYFVISDT